MNEEVLNDLYQRAVSEGYSKSREEFINLLHTNQEVFNDMYSYVQSKGYNKDQNSFSQLVGKSVEVPYSQPTEPVKKKEVTSMVSSLGTTPSDSQGEPPKITDYLQQQPEVQVEETPNVQVPYKEPEKREILTSVPYGEETNTYKKLLTKTIDEEISGLKGIGKSVPIGLSNFNELVTGIPEAIYNTAASLQNAVAAATGWDIATNSEKFKKNLGIRNPALDYYQEETKRLSEDLSKFNKEKYGTSSVSEAISKGNYSDAFQLLSQGIIQSAPTSLAMMAGGAMLTPTKLAAVSTIPFYGKEMEESMAENPNMSEIERNVKAFGMAAAETVFSAIGDGQIGAVYKDIIKKEGLENGAQIFKNNLIEMYKSALKKYPGTAGFLGEGLEEAATQITQNLISGRPVFEGAVDAFATGAGGGVMYTAPISLKNAKDRINNIVRKQETRKNISNILADKDVELNTVFNVSKNDQITPEQIKIASADLSRDILESDLKTRVKDGEMSTDDAKQAMYIFDRVQRLASAVKDLDVDDNNKAKIANLLEERNSIESTIKDKDNVLVEPQKKRIEEINNEIRGIMSAPKVTATPKYVINGTEYSKKDWIQKIGSMSMEDLASSNIQANNAEPDAMQFFNEKTKTIKPKEYAVQEQAAGQVPVQPTTGVGEKMEGGEPQAGPEVVATETVQEQVTPTQEVKQVEEVSFLKDTESTTSALESIPVEEKIATTFVQEDGTETPVMGNEKMLSDMYHSAVDTPENQRTEAQKKAVEVTENIVKPYEEAARFERELGGPVEEAAPTAGISISNNTEIENLNKSVMSRSQEAKTDEERQSNETKVKVIGVAKKVINTVKSIFPEIDIVIHDNEDSFNTEMDRLRGTRGSGGNYAVITNEDGTQARRIDINLSKANERTVAHEVAHAIFDKTFGENVNLFKDFRGRLSKILAADKNKELNDFANRYIDPNTGELLDVNHEEFLSELTGMLSNNETKIDTTTWQKIAALINEFMSTITAGKFTPFSDTKNTKDTIDFFNTISGAIKAGAEINLSEQGVSFNIGNPVKITSKAQKGEEINFPKKPYDLSFVTEKDKVDINKLIDDIITKGQKVWFWMADQLGRGNYNDEIIGDQHYLDAGPSFALDPKNRSKKILWASGLSKKVLDKNIKECDYIFFISGSPEKAKMFNKSVLNLIAERINKVSNFNDFKNKINSFKKETNELKSIKNALSKVNSFKELADSPRRKDFLIAINEIGKLKTMPEGSLKELLNSFNVFIDYNELRDGFYRENGFNQNDIMLVGKPTKVGGSAPHSTYENSIMGEVIGVPDTKINSWTIMPQELKDKYKKELTTPQKTKVIAAEVGVVRKIKSKSQQPEPTPAPKYVRDINVLITPATVRGFDTRTERIKDMSIKYDELVKKYAKDKDEETRIAIKELEDQILNDAQQEIIDEVNKIPGLSVKFSEPRMGLWAGAFEPSFNMTFSVTPQADTKKISDLLMTFGEKYSQDAFILETKSELHDDFVSGKIKMPLNEKDSNGLSNYPQIIYTFAQPISDEKVAELSNSLQANGIDAFNLNKNELKISVLTFLSDEQTKTLSEDEQYTEKFRDFESKSNSAEKSVGDVLGRDALDAGKIVIKRSHYQGAVNERTADATRRYDRSDILKPFQQGTTKVETLSKEFAELRRKQISGQKLTENEQARFNELEPIIQPVVQKTFETNKKLYDQAKNEVEEIAEKSIEDFDASISPFPIKKPERASVKTLRWYSGLTENLGDGARVNIIVRDDADADALFEKINKENPIKNDTGIRRINETTDLSYPKRLIEVRTPSGVIAEMQIITDKAYLAKDGIKGFTGGNEQVKEANKELDKIRKRLGWNIPDGLGHYFYEIQRDTNIDQSLRDEAKRLSNEYYDAFTNENSKLKESPFMGDVNKFRENVDKADKKNWDKGNTGKAPESLIKYKSKSSLAPKSELNDIIKKGRASGFSDAAIKIVLKKKGFSEADIDTAIKTEIGAAKKVTISEETVPGFDRMMTQVENIVNKSKKRGVSEEKIADNAMKYVMGSKVYENATDVQREQIIRDIEKKFGIKQKPSPKAEKILGIKEPAKITISEKEALKNQIKAEAKGAKNAVSAWRKASAVVSKMIKDMKKSGSITTTQAANVLRKFSGVNVLSSESIGRYVDYMSKVFADAEYANKLSVALESRKAISKLSKNKDKNANLRALGDKFKQIDPAMVEDIDEYNRTASLIKESIKGSTYRGATVMPAQMVNINEAMDYTEKTMKAQDKKMAEIKAAEIQEIMGIDASELSYEQMFQLLDSKEPITKYNEGIIRDTINRMFDVYSSMIDSMIESGIDPMTGEPVELSKTQKELVKKFMEMDLNKLTPKEALSAVDALNNFIVNKSTAKMETVVRQYTGDTNAINLADKGVKSKPLQMYWIKGVGRFFGEQFASLPTLIERMFKGVMAGAKIEKASGLTDVKNGKAEAESNSNRIVEEYVDKFYKEKANGEAFNTEANVTERGIVSFMSRSVTGTEEEIQQDFNRRKKLIEESIDVLSKGSEKEQAKAELYKAAYDKVLKDSYSAEDVRRKADKKNLEAVDFWIDKWSSIYDQLSDVSENVYNKILDKDIDYTPDRFTRLERAQEEIDLDSDQSVFHGNTNTLYKKETGVLMKAERPESLPKDDKGKKPAMYIDLSFDKNNANSMYDALVDINTAGPIRQVQSFLNSEGFDRMVPEVKDAKVLKERVKLYISNIRKKNAFDNDEMSAMMRKLNTISAIGVGQALGGILQPFKQTIPVAMNTLVNAGGLDIGSIFNSSKMNFIDNSGYAIANRGIESQTQLKSINKLMDLAAESKGIKALKYIEKANKIWLDIFLVKPDSFIARASWMSYYEQSLKKQGIDPGDIDYNTHKINKEAADYAQTMVDRQQNISDSDLQGKLFSSKTALSQLFVKTLLPFANFRMNQFMRLTNDITTLTSMTSSKEDKVIAARSLGGYSVEVAAFTAISTAAGMLLYELSKTMMGEGEDEEEEERRKSNMIKGQITGRVTDILSPLPFLDKPIAAGVNMAMDKVQEAMDIVKEDRLSIYGDTKVDMVKSLGTLGITLERGAQLYDLYDLARTGEYTDSYGNVKKISESSRAYLEGMTAAALLTNIGLAPSEVNNIVRNSIKLAKSTGKTEKTIEREIKAEENKTESRLLLNELKEQETDPELIDAIDKRISELEDKSEVAKEKRKARKEEKERLLQGYKSMDEMKRYDPELYEETFGEGSDYYEKHKDEVLINKAYNKLERQKRDEEMNYIPPPKESKKKKKGFGSEGFGTKGFGSKGFGSKGF